MHNEENYKQDEKAAFRMAEKNINEMTDKAAPKCTNSSYSSIPEKQTNQSKNGPKN